MRRVRDGFMVVLLESPGPGGGMVRAAAPASKGRVLVFLADGS